MINIGLIGAGNISDTHARAATAIPGVAIAAVHAPTLEHAQRLAARHGAVAYDTLDGLLSHRPLEMVAIGSPSGLHADQGIAAARQRLHVLVEKPIDVTTARTDALIAEAARAGVTLGVRQCGRVHRRNRDTGNGRGRPRVRVADVAGADQADVEHSKKLGIRN